MVFINKTNVVRIYALISVMFFALVSTFAQSSFEVDAVEAQKHLLKHVDPIYPPIAKAVHVQGEVVLQIEIGQDGHVLNAKPLSGPEMLRGAAADSVKQWKYSPFEKNTTAANVSTKVTVSFSLGVAVDPHDDEIAKVYFPLSRECIELVSQRADPTEEAKACQKAAEQADLFSKDSRFIERRSSYVYYTTSLIRDKRPKEAVVIGEKAIAVVLQGHDDGSGSSAAYGVTGQAKAFSGDLIGADSDLETAENFQRKALDTPAGHELNKSYSQTLKSLLSFHAQVLTAMNKQSEAQKKLEEANKL